MREGEKKMKGEAKGERWGKKKQNRSEGGSVWIECRAAITHSLLLVVVAILEHLCLLLTLANQLFLATDPEGEEKDAGGKRKQWMEACCSGANCGIYCSCATNCCKVVKEMPEHQRSVNGATHSHDLAAKLRREHRQFCSRFPVPLAARTHPTRASDSSSDGYYIGWSNRILAPALQCVSYVPTRGSTEPRLTGTLAALPERRLSSCPDWVAEEASCLLHRLLLPSPCLCLPSSSYQALVDAIAIYSSSSSVNIVGVARSWNEST